MKMDFLSRDMYVNKISFRMIIDTRANVTIIRTDMAQEIGEKLIWTAPCVLWSLKELRKSVELNEDQRSAAGNSIT